MSFVVGDVVRMKTGGRKMIVMKTLAPNRVEVAWMSKSNIVCTVMDQSMLEPDVGNGTILNLLEKMMATLDDLVAKANAETTVVASIDALLSEISQKLKEAGTDQVKLDEVASTLDNNRAALQAALVANTPGLTPVPTPVPDPNAPPVPNPVPQAVMPE